MEIEVNKPPPIQSVEISESFKHGSDVQFTIEALEAGKYILVTELYSNGLALLKDLRSYLNKKLPNKTFQEQREYRSEYRKLSNQILIEIVVHKLAVKKSPSIGWFEKLYPETNDFLFPGLRNKIRPYYGTYFPTRFDHLEFFNSWLKHYEGPKKSAIDVGFGSGVLSLQMVENGFQKVFATETNPNAIVGLADFMGNTKLSRKIELDFGHLFGKWTKQTELIVCNPPWLPESRELDRIDEAIYYNKNLFPDFFSEAKKRLLPEGKLVLLFSNLAQITNLTDEHPIEKELAEGGRFQLEKCLKRPVKMASKKTNRNQYWRSSEKIELWVLTNK